MISIHWKGPTYIKSVINGRPTQIYKFLIDYSVNHPDYLIHIADASYAIDKHIHQQQWLYILEQFIESYSRLFTRPLTTMEIFSKLRQNIQRPENVEIVEWFLEGITIDNNQFIANWNFHNIPQIDVGCIEDERVINEESNDIIMADISGNADVLDISELVGEPRPHNTSYLHREKARQRVKESRLNARLAYFRAKQDQRKYEEKYGIYETDYPTSDESDNSTWSEEEFSE
jgi:hypothetical protein